MAQALLKRLQDLEAKRVGAGRVIVVMGRGPINQQHVDDALAVKGIHHQKGDDLLVFITKYETRGGGVDPAVSVHSVTQMERKSKR